MASRTIARPSVRTTKLSGSIAIQRADVADDARVASAKKQADKARKALSVAQAQAVAEAKARVFDAVSNVAVNVPPVSGAVLLLEIQAFELMAQKWKVLPDNEATQNAHKVEVARLKRDYGINPDKFVAGDPLARWENTYDGYRLQGDLSRAAVKHEERSFGEVIEMYNDILETLEQKQALLSIVLESVA